MNYIIYIRGNVFATISGAEATYEAWRHASALADIAGYTADLVDGETGEVLESTDFEDDDRTEQDYEDYGPDPDECGFDPYEGCYTFDC